MSTRRCLKAERRKVCAMPNTKIKIEDVTIGADPELFVKDTQTGKFVSAHALIPGSKMNPYLVPDGAVQVDGLAAEFNIFPASSEEEFCKNISSVLSTLSGMVKDKNQNLVLCAVPTATFDKEYFDSLPEETKLLGCEPDFNAWTGDINCPPKTDKPFRTGGGHIHIGWGNGFDVNDPEHISLCEKLVRQLDMHLYRQSLRWDSDEERRQLYGQIGSYRPKFYGVEYRPLSNKWVS